MPSDSAPSESSDHGSILKCGLELGTASLLVLFLELVLIRWLPTQVQVVSYFPNLVLIAAFLGLGIGAIRSDRRSLLPFWPACLLVLVVGTTLLGRIAFTARGVTEHLWLLYRDLPQDAPVVEGIQYPLMALFALTTLCFVPLGQYVGHRLEVFRRLSSPLFGYSIDLGGSALGVTAFTVLSFQGAFPITWFVGVFILGAFLMRRQRWPILTGYLIAAALSVYAVDRTERAERYSPYYALKTQDVIGSTEKALLTNGSLHQMVMAVQFSGPPSADLEGEVRRGYHLHTMSWMETREASLFSVPARGTTWRWPWSREPLESMRWRSIR